jgi:uncharacterized protein
LKRSTDQLLFVLIFYLILAITILVSPLVFFWTSDELLQVIGTYTFIIVVSLVFIKFLGLKIPVKGFLLGSIAAIGSMGLIFAILLISGIASAISLRDNYMIYLFLGVVMQLFVAFGEELSFRATIFNGINSSFNFWPAAIISAFAFALLHIPSMFVLGIGPLAALIALCNIIIAGIVLAMLYKYGGLLNAVAFHFFWNFLEYNAFTLGSMQGALHLTEAGPTWLTGGSFGPEASIVALPIIAAIALIIWYYYKKKGVISQ